MYFLISGYWKDDNSEFQDYVVCSYDGVDEDAQDDDIFYFGISEDDIKQSIETNGNDSLEFVITHYSPFK